MSAENKNDVINLNEQGLLSEKESKAVQSLEEGSKNLIHDEQNKPLVYINNTADKKGRTWLGYMEHHQAWPVPKGKELEYLAKALAGAQMSINKIPFTLDTARAYARGVMKYDAVQQIAKSPERLRRIMQCKDLEKLREIARHSVLPFNEEKKEKQLEVLKNLKELHRHMDVPDGHSPQWKKLVNGINNINLDDPELDTGKALADVFKDSKDYIKSYLKSSKSLRHSPTEINCFNQCLDVLGELSRTNKFAKDAADNVLDTVNKKISKTKLTENARLVNFGLYKVVTHENEGRLNDPTAAGQDSLEWDKNAENNVPVNPLIMPF